MTTLRQFVRCRREYNARRRALKRFLTEAGVRILRWDELSPEQRQRVRRRRRLAPSERLAELGGTAPDARPPKRSAWDPEPQEANDLVIGGCALRLTQRKSQALRRRAQR
jgi:hypothetical protein